MEWLSTTLRYPIHCFSFLFFFEEATYNDEKGLNNWYKIEKRHFSNNHGEPLLHKYGFSPAKTVMALYPTVWIGSLCMCI